MKSSRVFSFFFFVALAAAAQTGTNSVATRPMSLPDCIQQALQQNFDVQIQRYNPQISLYNLRAAYGGYDPTFNISGPAQLQCRHRAVSIRIKPIKPRSTISDENSFNSGINGDLPLWDCNTISAAIFRRPMETMDFRLTVPVAAIGVTLPQPLLKRFLD